MRRSRKIVTVIVLVLAGLGIRKLFASSDDDASHDDDPAYTSTPHRTVGPDLGEAIGAAKRPRSGALPPGMVSPDGTIAVTGQVIDVHGHDPVPNVEVVFRSPLGETSATSGPDGKYRVVVAPGVYRAFVRDDMVLSVGQQDRVRLPVMPTADVAGVPDEGLMPLVVATADTDNIDLSVTRGGGVGGKVVDASGHAIEGVVLRARGGLFRPALGTDIAESDSKGEFEMKLPPGDYLLDAQHDKYAGVSAAARVHVSAGGHASTTIIVTQGCVISGKVRRPDGSPAADGAIEKKWGETDLEFGPAGRVEPDGSFRWVTTDEAAITLRAWPWKSPPSNSKTFACKDGARFNDVVFELPNRSPDIEGVLVDRNGNPVPFAFVDLAPLDNGIGQQERTDAEGHWAVYAMPAGRYHATATAASGGVVEADVASPQHGIRLVLSGTGSLDGTTTTLTNGSFEIAFEACGDSLKLASQRRIVTVEGGRFHIDDVPACELSLSATWHGHKLAASASVPAGGSAQVTLALGPAHEKTVHGTVRDPQGKSVPNAMVSATFEEHNDVVRTDDMGQFTIKTYSGAQLFSAFGGRAASGQVGFANIDREEVDLVLEQDGGGEVDVDF